MVSETLSASDFPIKSVKLYRSGVAEITRSFQIDSLRYQSTPIDVEITNLPTQLYSLRASLTGAQLALLDFHSTRRDASPSANAGTANADEPSALERSLTQRRLQLQDERRLKQQGFDFLSTFMRTLAEGRAPSSASSSGSGSGVEPAQVVAFFDDYVTAGKDRLESVAALDREIEDVERQLREEAKRVRHLREKLASAVCVSVSTVREAEVYSGEITLTYMVDQTSWKPKYELRTTTVNGSPSAAVQLHIRCSIEQDTGEDWDNAAVAFIAATSASHLLKIPDLKRVEIRAKPTGLSLFGSGNANNNNNNAAPGVFGSSAFGAGNTSSNNSNNAGNIFGQPQQHQQNQTSGLFGQPQRQQNQASGFFSQMPQQQQAPPLFGTQTQTQPAGFFGGTSAQPPAPAPAPGMPALPPVVIQPPPGAFGSFAAQPPAPAAPPPPPSRAGGEAVVLEEAAESAEELWALQTDIRMTSKDGKNPVVYEAPNRVSIPSDGRSHQVLIDIVTLEAKFMHIAVPSVDTRVFYCCGTTNNSAYDLIPGLIATFVDDKHVSDGTIRGLTKPQVIECCIGVDPQLTASYARNKTESMSTFADYTGTTTTSYISTVTIKNAHAAPVSGVVVRETLPRSDDQRFTVSLREPEGLEHSAGLSAAGAGADGGTGAGRGGRSVQLREGLRARWSPPFRGVEGHKEGRFEWVCEVPGGETTLKAVWEVSAPRNVVLEEVVRDQFHGLLGGAFGKKGV